MNCLNTIPLRLLAGLLLLAAGALSQTGCDDTAGLRAWDDQSDTLALYSLARTEYLGQPSAFDVLSKIRVAVERVPGEFVFDFAISESAEGFLILPSGVFPGVTQGAGLQAMPDTDYEALERVPIDGYTTDEPVPLEEGQVFAVRSRRQNASFSYGKIHIISLGADGVAELELFRNPRPNDRSLVPPEDD